MKKTITREKIVEAITDVLLEKLEYDKSSGYYRPADGGSPHSNAGSYADLNRNIDNARNDYTWHDKEKKKKFDYLQGRNDARLYIDHDIDIDRSPGNNDAEYEGEDYLDQHTDYAIQKEYQPQIAELAIKCVRQMYDEVIKMHPYFKNNPTEALDALEYAFRHDDPFDAVSYMI